MHGRGLVRKSALERPYQCISPCTILRPANLPFSGLCETGMAGAGRLHAGVDGGAKPRATARPAGRRWCPTPPRAGLLAYVLAIMSGANATTLREHTLRAAERAEAELGDERSSFIDGQSIPEDRDARHVGLVYTYDPKPKRRLFDLLKSQGLQANQDVTFLTDGGEEVHSLAERVTPESEHVLDCWGGRPHGIECQSWVVSNQHRSRPCPKSSALASTRPRPSSRCTASTKLVRRCCGPISAARRWPASSRTWRLPRFPWKRAAAPITGRGN